MNFWRRVTRCAVVAWALYLIVALSAFALHVHAPDEVGGPHCALCLAQHVTGAAAVATVLVWAAPALCWKLRVWLALAPLPMVGAAPGLYFSRGPPFV